VLRWHVAKEGGDPEHNQEILVEVEEEEDGALLTAADVAGVAGVGAVKPYESIAGRGAVGGYGAPACTMYLAILGLATSRERIRWLGV
jgi:hypothetical protein